MIHYSLQCQHGHEFDGWFADSVGFDTQAARGLIACPACGDTAVSRALMTPAVSRFRRLAPPDAKPNADGAMVPAASATPPAGDAVAIAGDRMPDHVRAVLQRLRAEVERNCDYVGPQFASEALRIHRGEADARGIYGEATPEQAEALADEGVDVSRIPWVPRADG
jgi:hypothetical protein